MAWKMNKCNYISYIFVLFLLSCSDKRLDTCHIIPQPLSIQENIGFFEWHDSLSIGCHDKEVMEMAKIFQQQAAKQYSKTLSIDKYNVKAENVINLKLGGCDAKIGAEGYILEVSKKKVNICANLPAGLFYGFQTLLQLLPTDNDSVNRIQSVVIKDKPRFIWRGLYVDVATHIIDKEHLKKYIDAMAFHKMNYLLLEMVNNHGWRIELKAFPNLTKTGAWREDRRNEPWEILESQRPPYNPDKPYYGGFYTKEDITELVEYAQKRYVKIVPVVSFPGKSMAIIASYPELSCSGEQVKIPNGKLSGLETPLCAGNDSVYAFLNRYIKELSELFPAEHFVLESTSFNIHSWKNCKKCQETIAENNLRNELGLKNYMMKRIENYFLSYGKSIVTFDDLMFSKLTPGAFFIVQSNDKLEDAIENNLKIISSPVPATLLSNYQDDAEYEPKAYPYLLKMNELYNVNIIPEDIEDEDMNKIIGSQAYVYTDFIQDAEMFEYMTFPRLCAVAEKIWSAEENIKPKHFSNKMFSHYNRLNRLDINYFVPAPKGLQGQVIYEEDVVVKLEPPMKGLDIRYTLDGTEPRLNSPVYKSPILISETTVLKARSFLPNGRSSHSRMASFTKKPPKMSIKELVNIYPGIKYQYYRGVFRNINDMFDSIPKISGVNENISIPKNVYLDNFGLVFEGLVFVKKAGIYTFHIASDDGSRVYVSDEMIIDNDGIHGANWVQGKIALNPGYHYIRVEYFDLNLNEALRVEYEGPGLVRQELTKKTLYYFD